MFSVFTLIVWGVFCLLFGRVKGPAADAVRVTGAFIASGFGIYAAVRILTGSSPELFSLPLALSAWSGFLGIGGSAAVFALDGVSAFFMLPVLILTPLCALYGSRYLNLHHQNRGSVWFFYYLLSASMLALLAARDSVVFLIAWEIMSLSSFFLVITDRKSSEARHAGLIYFTATHIGTAFLLVFFFLAGEPGGETSFSAIAAGSSAVPAGICFILALIGFGTKAGIVPFHIWLPEAHPAAPSHVSAVMSGVMIKMGIYGIVRTIMLLGPPPSWWGIVLMAAGALTGIAGILFAISQHDIKRLLAYSSVENIGIILLGLGIGVYGTAGGLPLVAVFGFGGAFLHVLFHSLFKGLLFLGAGSVISAGGTGKLDSYGGLLKSMPVTGSLFILGAAAISGLPPLNGFVSEFLLFAGAARGISVAHPWVTLLFLGGILVLALIGGLAAVCFTKASGILFLGEPRVRREEPVRESGLSMLIPMIILAVLIIAAAAGAGTVMSAAGLPIREVAGSNLVKSAVTGIAVTGGADAFALVRGILRNLVSISGILSGFVLALVLIRLLAGRRKKTSKTVTWDCGYSKPAPDMQYTASSFAQPLVDFFRPLLRTRKSRIPVSGYYPSRADFSVSTPDFWMESFYGRIIAFFKRIFERAVKLQHGSTHLYILYVVAALILLLVWKLR